MNKSNNIGELAKALAVFHLKVDTVKKDAKNPFFKSSYASLSNILDAINDPLIESGLTLTQFPNGDYGLTSILMHGESGEWIECNYEMKPVKDDPQGRGSCLSYMRRYSISAILLLNIDEDDDGNTATFGGKNPQEAEENNKPWLNEKSPEFTGAVEKLKSGKSSIPALRQYFKISKQMETILTKAANL